MKKISFDSFRENELSVGEKKSIKGGLLPGSGTTPPDTEVDPNEPVDPVTSDPGTPQWGGPIVITSGTQAGHVRENTTPIILINP